MAELRISTGTGPSGPRSGAPCRHRFCPDAGLVATTGMHSGATGEILRLLLRPLAALVFATTAIYFVRDLLLGIGHVTPWCVLVLLVMGAITAALFLAPGLGLARLRALEMGLYVALVGHLMIVQRDQALAAAASGDAVALMSVANQAVLAAIMVMASYALFVPNTWQRAALVLVPTAAAPVMLLAVLRARNPQVDALAVQMLTLESASNLLLPLGVGLVMALMGTGLIARYREATFSAREANLYALREQIGVGGMGEVWRAEHQTLARPAAIKIIRPEILGNGDPAAARNAVRRFEREAQATAALRSPHTVEIYDFGVTQEGVFYYVMEYLDGLDLDTLIKRHGPLSAARAIHILEQACYSLADAHDRGLVHRDVKPANIYVCRMGLEHDWVKVLDFGLVKEQHHDGETQLTVDGMTTGTPAYMAPEMALQDRPVTPATDVYALGCVAYWLLTGKLVFERDTPMAIVVDHVKTEPVAPSTRTELRIPPELDSIVLRCLAKDPDDRYASMMELAEALRAVPLERSWETRDADEWWGLHLPRAASPALARAS